MENSNGQSYTQRVGASIKNTIGSMKKVNTQEIISALNDKKFTILSSVIIVIVIILFIFAYRWMKTLESEECKKIAKLYPELNGAIAPINNKKVSKNASNNFAYYLNEYYIKTAYNACSLGAYKNNAVSTCILKDILKQGVRGLDFCIFSVDDMPVVATSLDKNVYVKETFNYVPFAEVLNILRDFAFSSSGAPNPTDPLIIHLRIQSNNTKMFTNMALLFKNLSRYVLGKEYSFENQGRNLGREQLLKFKNKMIVIGDKSNPAFLESQELKEYINLTSNSVFMRELRFTQGVKYTPDVDELKTYNKRNMTIVLPDETSDPENPSGLLSRTLGCQLVAMRYQLSDSTLKQDTEFFDANGHAFVLKPEDLRYIPTFIKKPKPPNKNLSYAPRDLSASDGLYNFDI